MNTRLCRVCGCDISKDAGRCTNSCCRECHAMFCTPGGVVSPGHGLNVNDAREKYRKLRDYLPPRGES